MVLVIFFRSTFGPDGTHSHNALFFLILISGLPNGITTFCYGIWFLTDEHRNRTKLFIAHIILLPFLVVFGILFLALDFEDGEWFGISYFIFAIFDCALIYISKKYRDNFSLIDRANLMVNAHEPVPIPQETYYGTKWINIPNTRINTTIKITYQKYGSFLNLYRTNFKINFRHIPNQNKKLEVLSFKI